MPPQLQQRHGIHVLFIQGEKISSDFQASEDFLRMSAGFLLQGYPLDDILYADEFGAFWKSLPSRTLAAQKEKFSPGMKSPIDRTTAMACANACRMIEILLLVIRKSKKPRSLRRRGSCSVYQKVQFEELLLLTGKCIGRFDTRKFEKSMKNKFSDI